MSATIWVCSALGTLSLITVAVSAINNRMTRSTSDFMVASRGVSPWLNAFAICGEYISGASYLGLAAMLFLHGAQMMMYPLSYVMGYFVLVVFLAAPLRRCGVYSITDFAQARFSSTRLRKGTAVVVLGVSACYLTPQLFAAGVALKVLTGAPQMVGTLLLVATIVVSLTVGGMRSVTVVQALQFWIKCVGYAVPAVVLAVAYATHQGWWPLGLSLQEVSAGAYSRARDALPLDPLHQLHVSGEMRLYVLLQATMSLTFGALGLPHVLTRMYSAKDGTQARRTGVIVIGLLGLFYIFPIFYALMARMRFGELPDMNDVTTLVLMLPSAVFPGSLGEVLTALAAMGAFAAFLACSTGMTLAGAEALDSEWLRPWLRKHKPTWGRSASFRLSMVALLLGPTLFVMVQPRVDLVLIVGLAFGLAGCTISPLLLLGVWWRRCTRIGIEVAMLVGFVINAISIVYVILVPPQMGWTYLLGVQTAPWAIPLSFGICVVVSLLNPHDIPPHTLRMMTRMHLPPRDLSMPVRTVGTTVSPPTPPQNAHSSQSTTTERQTNVRQ